MQLHPAEALDRMVQNGAEPGAAVVRDLIAEVDHEAGTRDGSSPWTSNTLMMTLSVAKRSPRWHSGTLAFPRFMEGAGYDDGAALAGK
jgi:hypothetical protein